MQKQDSELEELIQAICWKLCLEPDSQQLKEKWNQFYSGQPEQVKKISDSLAELAKEYPEIESLWQDFLDLLLQEADRNREIKGEKIAQWKRIASNEFKESVRNAIRKVLSPPTESTASSRTESEQREGTKDMGAVPQWKYLPVPNNEPDEHRESDCKSAESPETLKLIGARVRGKKHKHEGTNCDDWFELGVSGVWTIIAVSDGAGSKKFSRVGAKASCEAAVKELSELLKEHQINQRDTKEKLSIAVGRNANWNFNEEDIEQVQQALHQAMEKAYKAVEETANQKADSLKWYKALGNRELNIKDLSATLLLAVHSTIKAGDHNYNFVLTCQIGDGVIAAISQTGQLKVLSKLYHGNYGGETVFLTSQNQLQRNNLVQNTLVFTGNLKALMVMTDGVADDYFPYEPGMLELYGDLVLNQIINICKPDETEIAEHLSNTRLENCNGIEKVKDKFQDRVDRIIENDSNEPKQVLIRSVTKYANECGKSVAEIITSPALLAAGVLEEPMCNESKNMKPEEKLQLWLDSYYRKTSFDDRTLVILYHEEV